MADVPVSLPPRPSSTEPCRARHLRQACRRRWTPAQGRCAGLQPLAAENGLSVPQARRRTTARCHAQHSNGAAQQARLHTSLRPPPLLFSIGHGTGLLRAHRQERRLCAGRVDRQALAPRVRGQKAPPLPGQRSPAVCMLQFYWRLLLRRLRVAVSFLLAIKREHQLLRSERPLFARLAVLGGPAVCMG